MLPLVLDLARIPVALIGNGAAAERRLRLLDDAGAPSLWVYAESPSPALALAAGSRLVRRLPTAPELVSARLVFIADRSAPECGRLAAVARAGGALVHVEDDTALSDVHAPAVLRRGDLVIAVSTNGRAPRLAVQIKRFLARIFGPEWQARVEELAGLRRAWRRDGADAAAVAERTEDWTRARFWLPGDGAEEEPVANVAAETRLAVRR